MIWPALMVGLSLFLGVGQAQNSDLEGVLMSVTRQPETNFELVIENANTGEQYRTTTNDRGEFDFRSLPPGDYVLRTDIGQADTVRFAVGPDERRINLTMAAGGSSREPQVSVEVESVSDRTPAVSELYNQPFVRESNQAHWSAPDGSIYGALNLSLTTEGVHPAAATDPFVGPHVSGLSQDSNNFEIEGVDNNNRVTPGPLLYIPDAGTTTFAIDQFGSSTGGQFSAGGQFQVITQSGSNDVHGSAYWFLQNRQLDARDPRLDRFNLADKPRFDRNRIGGSIGFPVIANKLFGFANLEYIPYGFTRYAPMTSVAPTLEGLDMLALDPRVSQQNLNLLRQNIRTVGAPTALADIDGTQIPLATVDTAYSGHTNTWAGVGGLDFVASKNHRVAARYAQNNVQSSVAAFALPAFNAPSDIGRNLGTLSYTYSGGGSFVNQLRLGYNRLNSTVNPGDLEFNQGAFPDLTIQGADLALGPQYNFTRAKFNTFELSEGANWVFGEHELSIGGDARRILSSQSGFSQFRGVYGYSSLERFLLDQSPDVSAQRAFGDPTLNANQYLLDAWLQDAWRITPSLRVDLGLNYQWAQMPEFARRQGLNSSLDVNGVASFLEPTTVTDAVGPHIGVAYSPGHRFVIRAGGGIQYDTLYLANRIAQTLGPQSDLVTVSGAANTTSGFLNQGGIAMPDEARARLGTFIADQELPYTIHWNGGIQGSLWTNLTGSLRYVGNRGVHLSRFGIANPSGIVTESRNLPVFFDAPTQAQLDNLSLTLDGLRDVQATPEIAAGFTNPVYGIDSSGTSWYHAIVAEINQRMTRGIQLGARYTLADLQIDSYGTPADLGFNRGDHFSAPYIPDHRLSVNGLLDLGDLFHGSGVWGDIIANLSLSGTYTYMSDTYLPLSNGLDTSLTGFGGGGAVIVNPDGIGNSGTGVNPLQNSAGQIVGYQAINPDARFVRGDIGTFTNSQASIDLNQTNNFDVAAAKKFAFHEVGEIEFRIEAYNLFNSPRLNGVDIHGFRDGSLSGLSFSQLLPGSTSFGDLRSVLPTQPRSLLLGLRVTF